MAWLPALMAVIPRAICSFVRASALLIAPLALNVPVRWKSSSFR